MFDGGHARHATKEIAVRAFGQQRGTKVDEGLMHVMRRGDRGNAVDVCDGHGCAFLTDPDR